MNAAGSFVFFVKWFSLDSLVRLFLIINAICNNDINLYPIKLLELKTYDSCFYSL